MYLDILQAEAIDGLIAAPVNENDQRLKNIISKGMPVVCVDRGLSGIEADTVSVNNEEGAYNAVSYLVKSGYRRIAFISGLMSIPTSVMRENGYRKALEERGLYLKELVRYGDSFYDSGVKLCAELLDLQEPPDAIFAGNNLLTLGALETIHKRKKLIPKDIAIIGFDDMFWASSLNPPLTAVRQPAYEIGKRAGELLIQRINDPRRPCIKMLLNTELMIRNSC